MHPLVHLAKWAVESYIKKGEIISPPKDLPEEFLKRRAGTFITIEKQSTINPEGKSSASYGAGNQQSTLRGCIGTYLPTRINIAEEIIHNAVAAATEDYRFGPIEEKEIYSLSYTVYILSEPELVKDINDPTKFSEENFRRAGLNPKKFGIIVKTRQNFSSENLGRQAGIDVIFNGHSVPKTGLLLPDLEGVDTIEEQISIACRKAGIDPDREEIVIYRFTVEKYK